MNAGVHPDAGKYSLQTTKEPKRALLKEVIVNMKAIHAARDGLEEIAASGDRDHLSFKSSAVRFR